MPNKYLRKATSTRGMWSVDDLQKAMEEVQKQTMSVYRASIVYNVPRKTLERRLKLNKNTKGPMGPGPTFGIDNEKRLPLHIKEMQSKGFPLTIDDTRRIAYQFAEHLHIKHKFNRKSEKAGYDWLQLFLERNPDISLRKSEGVSYNRQLGMNRQEVDDYFQMIEKIMTENEILDKPGHIFNMDETGMQLNNRPGHVLAEKGSKAVAMSTSTEKGETITVIACCNAEGNFLPPACIMKGQRKNPAFSNDLPPGSHIFMSQKSAYITSEIFLEWMKDHFLPRKPPGKVLLLLDGHSTHCNSVTMLELANENDIILVSMPSHTSHYLQPLDVAVFKSLKSHFYEACRLWMKHNPGRRITRNEFGALLNQSWGKAATCANATSGFRATGVYPLNPGAIPNYAFCNSTQPENEINSANLRTDTNTQPSPMLQPGPSTSGIQNSSNNSTPTRVLKEISPVPKKLYEFRKRAKQVSTLLTSEDHIEKRRIKEKEKEEKEEKRKLLQTIKQEKSTEEIKSTRKRKALRRISDSSCEEIPVLCDSSDEDNAEKEEDNCRGCGENYYRTLLIEDWLQCRVCLLWAHENCTEFEDMCSACGKIEKKKLNQKSNAIGKGKGKGKGKKSNG